MLTEYTWTLCSGLEVGGLLFLNDSFSEDGAAEYGVVLIQKDERGADGGGLVRGLQIESVTFSWCNQAQALEIIEELLRTRAGGMEAPVTVRLEGAGHVCPLCQ